MKKFFKYIEKFILGGVTVLLSLILGLLWWILDADYLVPLWIIFIVVLGCYCFLIVIYAIFSLKKESIVYRLPTVKKIIKSEQNEIVFIVEKNDLFSQGAYTTICYQEDDESLEVVIGLGYVQSVTEKFLQIEVYRPLKGEKQDKIYKELQDSATKRKAIKIKPAITKDLWEGM